MIPETYIKSIAEKSRDDKYTSFFIRNFIFKVVDKALRAYYGDNYSTLCLQASAAVNVLLSRFNIHSQLVLGSVCVIEVYKDKNNYGWNWGGFWDNEHHIFVISEFSDLIDLTISQLPFHPISEKKEYLPLLPVWWSPISKWPPMIKYLPEKKAEISLSHSEMDSLDNFLNLTENIADDFLATCSIEDIVFQPILTGLDSLNSLTESGNEWLKYSKKIILGGINYPDEIIKREEELIKLMKQ